MQKELFKEFKAVSTPKKSSYPSFLGEFRVERLRETPPSKDPIDGPEKIAALWRQSVQNAPWFDPEKEHVVVFAFDTKYHFKGLSLVSIGSLNECIASPREIFRPVIVAAAYAFALMHNHPSGDPAPSSADRSLTRKLSQASEYVGLQFLDHVITPSKRDENSPYFSFREMGLL